MIARTTLALAVLFAALAIVPAASATSIGVGDCSKAGACAAVCVGSDSCPGDGSLACVGASYQVPQCAPEPAASTTASAVVRCMGLPCEIINAVCYTATKQWCVG